MRARRGFAPLGAALLCGALALAGCGGSRGSGSPGDSSDATSSTTSATLAFGDLEPPCGPGAATGATDQGVTDTSISIGYGDDAGFAASPGLNHEISDALRAMIDWCNEQGGINGRQLTGNYYDAAITQVNNAVADACKTEFFLVGESWALDSAQEQTRRGCGLPAVPATAVSPQFSNAPLMWQAVPNPVERWSLSAPGQLADMFPEKVAKAAAVFGNFAATVDTKDKVESTFPAQGWKFVGCDQEYNLQGEADWKPFVQRLKDCGVEAVYFTGSPYPNFENLLVAAQQLDYTPIWLVDSPFYNPQLSTWNVDGAGDGVYFRLGFLPFDEATPGSATQAYLDLMKAAGDDATLGGASATSSFLLWATAAKACGADLTRECVGQQLEQIREWTGGGLHAPTDPGGNNLSDCGILMVLQGTSFTRVTPTEAGTYDCDPSYIGNVTGPVLEKAKLDQNGVSQL
jgi:ABC-type branched-subunit amino acid transport system substrate-binding protein